jgi:hypothetical protein
MTLSEAPGAVKRFRRTPWRFQKTFQTPLKDLQPFVATIFSAHESLQDGCVTIEQVVFEPKHLSAVLAKHSLPAQFGRDLLLAASGREEAAELLEAALGDWIDFIFVPTPKPFVIYADHDEYTTFYANTKSNLDPVVEALSARGFKLIQDYERDLQPDKCSELPVPCQSAPYSLSRIRYTCYRKSH